MQRSSSLQTPIKRVRGLGAAHSGTHHFLLQRVSALALIPLALWFMTEILTNLLQADRAAVVIWLSDPITALLMGALVMALFIHARLGVQTIIEDYIPHEGKKIALLLLLNAMIYGFGAAALLAIFKMHFSVI